MHQPSLCIETADLARFLENDLADGQESSVIEHLDACETCRRRLETMAAADDEWQNLAQCLREATPGEGISRRIVRDDQGSSNSDSFDAVGDILGYLGPTDDPQMLGRLGPYEIVGVIGRGGMGVVLKGHDRPLNRFVAIKVLAPMWALSGIARQRFAREARAAAAVVHQHVIAIHQVDEFRGLPYLVMPYLSGPSLQRRIDRAGALSVLEVLRISRQVALGLAAAHEQGLVHRDVKPANILLESDVERVTITDFGLARAIDDVSITQPGIIAGTPQYMSPEQSRGEAVDHRSDLFSLGSVMYAMCTGLTPFRGDETVPLLRKISDEEPRPIRELNPEVPQWLEEIVQKLHRKRPTERFQSACELAALLEEYLVHLRQPTVFPAPRRLPPAGSRRYSSRSVLTSLAALALLSVGALWWGIGLGRPAENVPSNDNRNLVAQADHQVQVPASATAFSQAAPPERQLRFHRQPLSIPATLENVRSLSFSKDGRLLAVAHGNQASAKNSGPGTVHVWNVQQRKTIASFFERYGVSCVALSPDEEWLAFGTFEKLVKVFDLATKEEVHRFEVGQAGPAVAFLRNGSLLAATGDPAGVPSVWSAGMWDRREVKFEGEPIPLLAICFSPDGKKIAGGGGTFPPDNAQGQAAVWDISTGQRIVTVKHPAAVMGLEFSPDSDYLATAGLDARANLWELASGDATHTWRDMESGLVRVGFLPSGKSVVTLGPQSGIKFWNKETSEPLACLHFENALVTAMSVSADGSLIASGGIDRAVRVWDVATRAPLAVLQAGDEGEWRPVPILAVTSSPDGRIVALGGEDGGIVLRKTASGAFIRRLSGHNSKVTSLLFTSDGRTLLSGSDDNTIAVWDAETGERQHKLEGHKRGVTSLALSADEATLASGSSDGTVRLWKMNTGETAADWPAHAGSVEAVSLSSGGKRLLTGGGDQLVKVWDVASQEVLLSCDGHRGTVRVAAFSPDGQTIASGGEDGRIILRNAETGLDRRTLSGHRAAVWCLVFSKDGQTLMSGGNDRLIHLWDVKKCEQRQTLPGHGDTVTSVTLLPGSGVLISSSLDRSVKFWMPDFGGQRDRQPQPHPSAKG